MFYKVLKPPLVTVSRPKYCPAKTNMLDFVGYKVFHLLGYFVNTAISLDKFQFTQISICKNYMVVTDTDSSKLQQFWLDSKVDACGLIMENHQ